MDEEEAGLLMHILFVLPVKAVSQRETRLMESSGTQSTHFRLELEHSKAQSGLEFWSVLCNVCE